MDRRQAKRHNDPAPTRHQLINGVKDLSDNKHWQEFFETYRNLICNTATKAGLTEAEAQDVLQETMSDVSRLMPSFNYSETGSFKRWLLRLTMWRINDQFRKRDKGLQNRVHFRTPDNTSGTATEERIPDPAADPDSAWKDQWKKDLLEVAVDRVRRKVEPSHFQAFDLLVLQRWPMPDVVEFLGYNTVKTRLLRYRVARLVKKEYERLAEGRR